MLASVVIPVFNHRRFIASALRSVHAQTWADIEIIVIDDASTDGSADALRELTDDPLFASRFRHVVVQVADRNQGAAATIETGLRLASGDILAILNSDDLYHSDRIASCVAALRGGHELAFTGIACIDADGRPDRTSFAARLAALPPGVRDHPTVSAAFLGVNRAVSTGNLVFTRALHRRIGGFRNLPLCHDWDFVLSACRLGEPAFVDRPLYGYRLHGDNSFRDLAPDARDEGKAVVGRFVEAILRGEVRNPALAALADVDTLFERLLACAGPDVAHIAREISGGSGAADLPPQRVRQKAPLARIGGNADGRPPILVVLDECHRGADAILALNIAGHLRRTYAPILLARRGGRMLDTLQTAFGRVVVADPQRAADPALLADLVGELHGQLPLAGVVTIGAFPDAFHSGLQRMLLPSVLVARRTDDLAVAASATAVLAARPGLDVAGHPLARTAAVGASDYSMARTKDEIRAELPRLRAALGLAEGPGAAAVVMGFGATGAGGGSARFRDCAAALAGRLPPGRVRFVWVGDDRQGVQAAPLDDVPDAATLPATRSYEAALRLADLVLMTGPEDLPILALDAMTRGIPVLATAEAAAAALLTEVPQAVAADPEAFARLAAAILAGGGRRHPLGRRQQALAGGGPTMIAHVAALSELLQSAAAAMAGMQRDIATLIADELFDSDIQVPPGTRPEPRREAVRLHVLADAARGTPRRPFPGFHPGIYAEAAMADAAEQNPAAHFIRAGRPAGPWLREVIRPTLRPARFPQGLRVAIHLHVHHVDVARDLLARLPDVRHLAYDLLVTTDDDAKARHLRDAAAVARLPEPEMRLVPNRGRNLGALLCGPDAGWPGRYDVVGHFHTKRSVHLGHDDRHSWRWFLLENLLGGFAPMAARILSRFADDPRLGLVHADDPHLFGWNWHDPETAGPDERFGAESNLAIARRLGPRLGLGPLPGHIEFPAGAMFWWRPDALAPLFDLGLGWDDFPPEPLPLDGTLPHAIERLPVLLAEARGYRTAVTHIPGVRR